MESVTPEELYLCCKADSEEQQLLAKQMAEAAEAELLAIGIPLTDLNRSRFSFAVIAMALRRMDYPDDPITPGIRGLINQLKFNH